MILALMQIRSVLVTECILRLRRASTVVLFLILCAAAFMLMPQTGAGGVMFIIAGHRVLLNSAAAALTSAMMGGLVLSLIGFYLISNAVTRDLHTGVGRLIAATPVSSARYLAGKFVGNSAYLTGTTIVFMVACMGMHMLRGEAPLEPVVFAETFGIMFLPLIPTIAALALVFECVPFLSGRGGDLFYFLIWMASLGFTVAVVHSSDSHPWVLAADITGMGFFVKEIIAVSGASNFTIGSAPYNAALSPVLFSGLQWLPEIVMPRVCSALLAIPLFGIAWTAFHRFDPARRRMRTSTPHGMMSRARQRLAAAWMRIAVPRSGWMIGTPSLLKIMVSDARLTLALNPIVVILAAASFCAGIIAPTAVIREAVLPAIFVVLVPLLSTVSTRDRNNNTVRLVFSSPLVREHVAVIKFFSTLLSIAVVGCIPIIRLGIDAPWSALVLLNGMMFMAAASTFLGMTTHSPKSFTVAFLLFLYVAMSSKTVPAFDFAGLQMIATSFISFVYTAAAVCMVGAVWGAGRWTIRRDEL